MARRLERHLLNDAVIAAAVSNKLQSSDFGRQEGEEVGPGPGGKEQGKPSEPCGLSEREGLKPVTAFPPPIEGAGLQVLLETRPQKKQQKIDQYDLTYHPSKI